MMTLPEYAAAKDSYCVCYYGHCDEYVILLTLLRPVLERHFPGLRLSVGCRDDKKHLYDGVVSMSEIRADRRRFSHVRELTYDGRSHPVESLLDEAGVTTYRVATPAAAQTKKCVIVTRGTYPTKNMERRQVESAKRVASDRGFDVEVGDDAGGAGLVVGVESLPLFEAARRGVKTILVPTGPGERLYTGMFGGEVLRL